MSFLSDLKKTDGISYLLLQSICCDITHHVASSKWYCAFMRKGTQQITSQCDYENSFDLADPLKAILTKQWFAMVLKPYVRITWAAFSECLFLSLPHTSDSLCLGWVPDLRMSHLFWFFSVWWKNGASGTLRGSSPPRQKPCAAPGQWKALHGNGAAGPRFYLHPICS